MIPEGNLNMTYSDEENPVFYNNTTNNNMITNNHMTTNNHTLNETSFNEITIVNGSNGSYTEIQGTASKGSKFLNWLTGCANTATISYECDICKKNIKDMINHIKIKHKDLIAQVSFN